MFIHTHMSVRPWYSNNNYNINKILDNDNMFIFYIRGYVVTKRVRESSNDNTLSTDYMGEGEVRAAYHDMLN